MSYTSTEIARIAHEANRAVQALNGDDMPSVPWFYEPRSLRRTVEAGVRRVQAGATPEQNHVSWCDDKYAQGWVYGPEKNTETKIHPCLVSWAELPAKEQAKARLFCAIVLALSGDSEGEE